MQKYYYVYIVTTKKNSTLYTGVTGYLEARIWQHKQRILDGFTKKYSVNKLLYYEAYDDVYEALHREKCIKRWKREWKINLIEKMNPEWNDLFELESNPIPASAGMTE